VTGRTRKWTDEQLREAVAASSSIYGIFRALGLRVGGGQHILIKKHIARLGLDTSHFTGQGWNRGNHSKFLHPFPAKPLAEILAKDSSYLNTVSLKRRLIREGFLRNECDECSGSPFWRGKPLVLRLDHVNGDRTDNRLQNLRLLCPNCDSQTETFAGRNKGKH
jgi:hypothetical protein